MSAERRNTTWGLVSGVPFAARNYLLELGDRCPARAHGQLR